MKTLFLYSIIYIIPFLSEAQIPQKTRRVVSIHPQQVFHLNGDFKASGGAPSRANYSIQIPLNTIEWYYMFQVSIGKSYDYATLNLIPQLEVLLERSEQPNIEIAALTSPTGTAPSTVYLLNEANADAFIKKVDQRGQSFSFIPSGTKEKINNAVVQVKDAIYGSYWLGFREHGTIGGITIRLEAAAIVEDNQINNSEWESGVKGNLFRFFYENVKGKLIGDEEAKDIASCMIGQLTSSKTPGDYYAMSQQDKDSFLATTYKLCAAKYDEPKGPNYDKASNYANLAWIQYERGNIDSSIALNNMSLALDSSLPTVKANLGLLYLIRNDVVTAKSYYEQALEGIRGLKFGTRKKEYLEVVVKNLDEAVRKYPGLKWREEIKKLFGGQ